MQPPKKTKYQIPKGKPKFETERLPSDNTSSYTSSHKNIIKHTFDPMVLLDPTGISNYPDLISAFEEGRYEDVPLELLGSLPMIGKFGKTVKLLKTRRGVPLGRSLPLIDDGNEIISSLEEKKNGGTIMKRTLKYKNGGNVRNPNLAKSDLQFQDWYKNNTLEGKRGINFDDPNLTYDYFSYYKNTPSYMLSNPVAHFPDTYKLPNHPTFSNESNYSGNGAKGYWKGEKFIKYKKGGLVKHELGEVVKQGLSFEDPAVTSAGMNLAASAIDLGLDYLPNNTTTDADGNVIGSVDSRGVAIGRGALKGAAAGAALGPIGMGVGAAIGGVSSLISRNKEAEELKKAQTLSNRNIFTKRIFGKANSSNGLMTGTNTELYPHGGTITNDNPNANAELELNEQFQLPNGVVGEVDGPSHDNGGIEVALPEGTRVYSDRLKMGNKTFAQLTKPINNKIAKLDKKPDSKAKENTLALFNKQLDELFTIQESMKTEEQVQKFAKGGLVKYTPGGEIGILEKALEKSKQPMIAATGMINSWKQQRNLDKVPRPTQIGPVALTAGASPDMVDFSAERAAIDSEIAASNKGIELGSGSYSTQAANKQKMRSLQLAKRGESFQKQNNLNTQTNNAFKAAQAAAANQSAQINVGLDQYNLENQMNYNMWKTGNKNAISAANTRLTTDMLNNSIMYDNQMAQARVLAGKYADEVAKDAQFGKYGGKSIQSKKNDKQAKNLDISSKSYENISILPKTGMFKDTPYDDLYKFKKGGTIKRSLKKTRK